MKKNILLLLLLIIPFIGFSQQTYIPDDNFENYLELNGMGNGVLDDDSVLTSNINTVTLMFNDGENISDLTGIEDFTLLESLFCYNNNLTELDLSNNLSLQILFAHGNPLSCIKVWDTVPFLDGTINIGSTPGSFYVNNNSPINVTSCESYWWSLTDSTYYNSGIYTFDLANVNGCDSTIILNLTIITPTVGSSSVTACDTYTWEGQTITQSDTLTHTYVGGNAAGCDSTHTLTVTINNSTIGSSSVTACDTYTWEGQTITQSDTLTHTYVGGNAAGCDSTHTLTVTINNSSLGSSSVTACDTYTWEGQTITQSDTLTHTYVGGNAAGCDSTHTLIVTINNSSVESTSVTACDAYWWSLTDSTYTASGLYHFDTTNINGCDSTIILDLTIQTIESSITQLGSNLSAVIDVGDQTASESTNWYNIQTINDTQKIWLMKDSSDTFSPRFNCSYFIVVEDDLGCKDTSSIYYYSSTASRIGEMITYPNPTKGLISLEFINERNQFVILELINNNGVKLDEFITTDNKLDINLSKYPAGIYYIYFDSTDNTEGCLTEQKQKKLTKIILNK
jgi:hypothetical protein